MASPTASERGISATPDIKLTHRMTLRDVQRIVRVTGGIAQDNIVNARTYYDFGGGKGDGIQCIKYPLLDAEINFIGSPIAVIMDRPQATLRIDKSEISLNNSAVVIGEDRITFVRRPQLEVDPQIDAEQNVIIISVIIARDGITYHKTTTLRNAGEDIVRAANMIDEAYRIEHVGHVPYADRKPKA